MIWTIILLSLTIIILLVISSFIIIRLNKYLDKLEQKIGSTHIEIENLKQSFRDVLVDQSFLLDDGKIKKTLMEEAKINIFNGSNLREEGVDF